MLIRWRTDEDDEHVMNRGSLQARVTRLEGTRPAARSARALRPIGVYVEGEDGIRRDSDGRPMPAAIRAGRAPAAGGPTAHADRDSGDRALEESARSWQERRNCRGDEMNRGSLCARLHGLEVTRAGECPTCHDRRAAN